MPNLAIENLGRRGINLDLAPFELIPEEWSQARNVRFSSDGAAEKFLGHAEIYPTTPLHPPLYLFPWFNTQGYSWLYPGTNRIGRITGTSHTDVTRFTAVLGDDDYAVSPLSQWSGTLIGDLPVLTYGGGGCSPPGFLWTKS